jgi:hypothetical protein
MDSGDRADATNDDIEVRQLLRELDELHELDRKRKLQPRNSAAYAHAVSEVDRRSRALIDRLQTENRGERSRRDGGSERQLA